MDWEDFQGKRVDGIKPSYARILKEENFKLHSLNECCSSDVGRRLFETKFFANKGVGFNLIGL